MSNFFEDYFFIVFIVIFLIVVGGILFTVIKGIVEGTKNSKAPAITTQAKVLSKREVTVHQRGHGSHTTYYVRFEFETKDTQEFTVSRHEYGVLNNGVNGKLTFKRKRYVSFEEVNDPYASRY